VVKLKTGEKNPKTLAPKNRAKASAQNLENFALKRPRKSVRAAFEPVTLSSLLEPTADDYVTTAESTATESWKVADGKSPSKNHPGGNTS
jgi:hypothetical protein